MTAGLKEQSAATVARTTRSVFRGERPETIRNPEAWERTKRRAMRLPPGGWAGRSAGPVLFAGI
ncbi:hypothetical protein GCM10017083_31490 [Thalassobaculum fulvum]|uniref:Uncharacterized protein n=1 Tax=Thalassobaculum fulvum TaxID=1633335 RepID=A0A918XTG1_9PROT|nr:hypothetical protein GCM10017083_31490 [Thalassobaculum fulvum]